MAEDVGEKAYQEKAEAKLTPVERVMTNARYEIMSHEDDLAKAGVTADQLAQASRIAEDRVQTEFKEKEAEDPIRRVANMLHESATTEDEKVYADLMDKNIEYLRSKLSKDIAREKSKANKQSKEFDLEQTLRDMWTTNDLPNGSRFKGDKAFNGLVLPLLDGEMIRPDSQMGETRRLVPSEEYISKVLRGIGAIEQNENIHNLKLLTPYENVVDSNKPYYDKSKNFNFANNVPANNISGIEVAVSFDKPSARMLIKDINTIQKIVDFPTS